MSEKKIKTEELEQGKIYYLDYGSNTQIIGRYKSSDVCHHFFYDLLHYWNGYETFRKGDQYCVTSGIENLPVCGCGKPAIVNYFNTDFCKSCEEQLHESFEAVQKHRGQNPEFDGGGGA